MMYIFLCIIAFCSAALSVIIWCVRKEMEAGEWIRHHRYHIEQMLGAWNIHLITRSISASGAVEIRLAFRDKETGLQTTGEITNRKAARILMEMEDVNNPRHVVIKYAKREKEHKPKQYSRAPRIGKSS